MIVAALAVVVAITPGCKKAKPTDSGGNPGGGGMGGVPPPLPLPGSPPGSVGKMPSTPGGPPAASAAGGTDNQAVVAATGKVEPLIPESDARSRQISSNNLKQIGLAWHNFHSVSNAFPAGIYDASGQKLGLSWRVAILPYIEQVNLYKQFKLNEPWDSENNKKLIPLMPKTYAPPGGGGKPGFTYYRAFTGAGTVLPPPAPGTPGKDAFGLGFLKILDGTSNTAIVAEAADPVEWTKPDELEYIPGKPLPRLGGVFGDGFHVGMADGSVQFLPTSTPPEKIKAIITIAGGETVKLP